MMPRSVGDVPQGDMTPTAAVALQRRLASQVVTADDLGPVRTVAGTDVGFESAGRVARAAVVVLRLPELELVEQRLVRVPARFPYIPGLLSFRELPALLCAIEQLRGRPDVLLCDGQGLAHPRRFGLACHAGLESAIPSIGVAKSRLIGVHGDVPEGRGDWVGLYDRGQRVGGVLRSRRGVKPIFVSVGHRVCLETAIELVMACTRRYRLPETTRRAHQLASGVPARRSGGAASEPAFAAPRRGS